MNRALTRGELAIGWTTIAVLMVANWLLSGSESMWTAVLSAVAMACIWIPSRGKPYDLYWAVLAIGLQLFSIVVVLLHQRH